MAVATPHIRSALKPGERDHEGVNGVLLIQPLGQRPCHALETGAEQHEQGAD